MTTRCGICLFELSEGERGHPHIPDFYLKVWNCQAYLVRYREFEWGGQEEVLSLELPEHWVDFIITKLSGGSISRSGIYRLPQLVWEWIIAKLSGDEPTARLIARRFDKIAKTRGGRV